MSVLNSSTSVQMVSWRPCRQTHVAMAVLSPSRLGTTCRILAWTCIVPPLHLSSNLSPPLSAPTGLSGVRSFASRAPASISWTRLLDVLSRSGGTAVRRWTRPTLMNYKWNLDCLHLLHPPRLLSWPHTSRPSVAWRSRLPSSTPTLSHNEGDERNAGTRGETRQKCIYLTRWNRPTSCAGGCLSTWNIEHMTVTCWSCVAAVTTATQSRCERPAAPLFVTRDRWSIFIVLFLFIKIETLDCNSPTLSSRSWMRSFTCSVDTCAAARAVSEGQTVPQPLCPLKPERSLRFNHQLPLHPAFWSHPLKTSLICRLKCTRVTNACLNSGVRYLRAASQRRPEQRCRVDDRALVPTASWNNAIFLWTTTFEIYIWLTVFNLSLLLLCPQSLKLVLFILKLHFARVWP